MIPVYSMMIVYLMLISYITANDDLSMFQTKSSADRLNKLITKKKELIKKIEEDQHRVDSATNNMSALVSNYEKDLSFQTALEMEPLDINQRYEVSKAQRTIDLYSKMLGSPFGLGWDLLLFTGPNFTGDTQFVGRRDDLSRVIFRHRKPGMQPTMYYKSFILKPNLMMKLERYGRHSDPSDDIKIYEKKPTFTVVPDIEKWILNQTAVSTVLYFDSRWSHLNQSHSIAPMWTL
jgi:hypothetical protein